MNGLVLHLHLYPLLLTSHAVRTLYFALLTSETIDSRDVTTQEYLLTDMPLHLFISVMMYLALFWVLLLGRKAQYFYHAVALFCVPFFAIFLAIVLLFELLPVRGSVLRWSRYMNKENRYRRGCR
jgi:hypothetical protein